MLSKYNQRRISKASVLKQLTSIANHGLCEHGVQNSLKAMMWTWRAEVRRTQRAVTDVLLRKDMWHVSLRPVVILSVTGVRHDAAVGSTKMPLKLVMISFGIFIVDVSQMENWQNKTQFSVKKNAISRCLKPSKWRGDGSFTMSFGNRIDEICVNRICIMGEQMYRRFVRIQFYRFVRWSFVILDKMHTCAFVICMHVHTLR